MLSCDVTMLSFISRLDIGEYLVVLLAKVGLHLTVVVSSRLTYTAFQRFMSSITPRFGHFSTEKRRPQSQNCPKLTKRERETPLNRARQADHGLMGSYPC